MTQEEMGSIEKLVRRKDATNDDGTVNVEVFDWFEDGDVVTIEFLTPTMDKKEETMAFPQSGKELKENKFYQIVDGCNIPLRNAEMLEGEIIKSTGPPNWKLVTEEKVSRKEKTVDWISSLSIDEFVALTWTGIVLLFTFTTFLYVIL